MIAFLDGVLAGKAPQCAYVDVGGVGYAVLMSQAAVAKLPAVGERVRVLTYLQAGESGIALYGFLTDEEKALFERLITVSGVGKKTASRIILELKGSLELEESLFDAQGAPASDDGARKGATEALLSMGFTSVEADLALKGAPDDATEAALLQYALKRLGNR